MVKLLFNRENIFKYYYKIVYAKYLFDVCSYPHVHISQMHFSLCFLSDVVDDLMAKSSFTVDVLDVEVLVFMILGCTLMLLQINNQNEFQILFVCLVRLLFVLRDT